MSTLGLAQNSNKDFLPLSVGNSWTYDYSTSSVEQLSDMSYRDSGLAVYKIESKSILNDSIIWKVSELRDIVSYSTHYFPPQYSKADTIKDSTNFSIVEYLSNNHRLKKTGSVNWKSIFSMTEEFGDSVSYFRYYPSAQTDTFSLVTSAPKNSPYQFFSTTYQKDVGIIKVLFSIKNITGYTASSNHKLKSSIITSIQSFNGLIVPNDFLVFQNYPNPFNPFTNLRFVVSSETKLAIRVYDLLGRLVDTVYDNRINKGEHTVTWNADNKASGIYYCVFQSSQFSKSIKIVLLK